MAGQKLKSARTIAVEVLNQCDPVKNYARPLLDAVLHSTGRLTAETDQRQRATDLVFGTLRNRRAIDTVISAFSGRPVERIQAGLLNIIRVGTYELVYCPSTGQYAIVNEAVLNAKASGSVKQAGFVNAILRQITKHISNRQWAWPSGGVTLAGREAECTLLADSATGCQFDTSFLPDRQSRPAEYLSTVFSLPEWLVAEWLDEFGEESARQICIASNRRPSVYIRTNPLKTTIDALTEKMAAAEIGFEIVADAVPGTPCGEMIRIKSPRDVTKLPGFSEGHFSVQDITASKPVRLLNPQSGWRILDLCAAPGTKTTQLAETTGDSAKIIATDIDVRRLEMVKENTARLGIKSVDVVPYKELLNFHPSSSLRVKKGFFMPPQDTLGGAGDEAQFDCILLDVPCSNTGVLARRVEARYRINSEMIEKLAGIQGELLRTASGLVNPGGKICYSTCSIQKCENSEIIEDFLKQNQNFALESQQLTLPSAEGFDHDGGYSAILAKRETHDS